MPLAESVRDRIPTVVRAAILDIVPVKFAYPNRELAWEAGTDKVFRNDVPRVLLVLDKICADFDLDFDPNMLPQQSVFRTFPRLANLCAYLAYRLTNGESGTTSAGSGGRQCGS